MKTKLFMLCSSDACRNRFKKSLVLFCSVLFCSVLFNFTKLEAQGPPQWKLNGNNLGVGSTDFIGTTSATDLVFKTNNQERVIIKGSTGGFKIISLQGSGNALVKTDPNGELSRINIPNNYQYVLNGNGFFVDINTLINVNVLSGWSTSGSSVTLTNPNANVGIGVTNPTCKLEVLGCANIHGELRVDSIQVGDSSLHIVSSNTGILDPLTALLVMGTYNEIYTDPACSPPSGGLFINCRPPSICFGVPTYSSTVFNQYGGRVFIGSPVSVAGIGGGGHKLYVVGTQRVSKGTGSGSSFVDLVPSTSLNTSIEIGSFTNTGQIDFKQASGPAVDYKGRMAYTVGSGFDFYTGGNIKPQLHIHENGSTIINGTPTNPTSDDNLSIGADWLTGSGILLNSYKFANTPNNLSFAASKFLFHGGIVQIGDALPPLFNTQMTTPSPGVVGGYNLYVQYGILTERVKVAVANSTDWADYTFADDYQLLSLDSVEKYIDKNNHLKGIPSAEDMVKNGNDLGLTDKLLLEKIEELYLYIIQLNKEIKVLKVDNEKIENLYIAQLKENELLKAQNDLLKAQNELLILQKDEKK